MIHHVLRRRELLKRLGAAAFLAAPVFRDALAEAQSSLPQRLVILQWPGGARYLNKGINADFSVTESDHSFNFGKVLGPLTPLRDDLLMLEKIGDLTRPGNEFGHTSVTLLTGDSRMADEDSLAIPPGTNSIDQVIASAIGSTTRFGSLQMGMNTEGWEYTLTHNRIVFANGSRIAPVTDPMVMFTRLFADALPTPSAPTGTAPAPDTSAMERLYAQRLSILDLRKAELAELRAVSGVAEHGKLDEHLTALRELERRIPTAGMPGPGTGVAPMPSTTCGAPTVTNKTDMTSLVQAMTELSFQAMNCDLSRVITLQWDASDLSFLGLSKSHHNLQHDASADFDTVQTWYMQQIAAFIQRFKGASEAGGTLLDSTAILVISEQSNSAHHTAIPTFGFIAGKAGGKIRNGGSLIANQSSLNDFYVGLARAYGVNLDTFGEAKFISSPLSLA